MIRPDLESLRKWRQSLEEQKAKLDEMIADCDLQLSYFGEVQTTPPVPPRPNSTMGDSIMEILKKGLVMSKSQIIVELKNMGYSDNAPSFSPVFNGFLGAHVKNGRVNKTDTGSFVIAVRVY